MLFLSSLAALSASAGWAVGTTLAERPAVALGSFNFIRIQVVACSAILFVLCSSLSLWSNVSTEHCFNYATSALALLMGLLCFASCLRMGGPRRAEIAFSLRAPVAAVMAYFWLGETVNAVDVLGGALCLLGVVLAIAAKDRTGDSQTSSFGNLSVFCGIGLLGVVSQCTAFLAAKPALESGANPFAVTAIQLMGAAMIVSVVAPCVPARTRSQAPVTPSLIFRSVLPGLIGYVLASSALLYALTRLDAGVALVLGSLAPVFVIPIQSLRDRTAPPPQAIVGAAVAIIGTSVIVVH